MIVDATLIDLINRILDSPGVNWADLCRTLAAKTYLFILMP